MTQARAERAPTVELRCEVPGRPNDECLWGTILQARFTAVASDANGDTLTYTWTSTGGRWEPRGATPATTEASTVWGVSGPQESGSYIIKVTVSDGVAETADASSSITVSIPNCAILVDGNSGFNPADDILGYPAEGGVGKLKFRKGADSRCSIPSMGSFETRPRASWITATNEGAIPAGTDNIHTHFIEYTVAANGSSESRGTSIGTRHYGWGRFIHVGQAGARRPTVVPTCPTTAITDRSSSWTVGGRYYGSGFTKPWAYMGYDGSGRGCRANGLPLGSPGRVRLCGYNDITVSVAACRAAARAPRATSANDPTAGAVKYVTPTGEYSDTAMGNRPAAQWVEFLVQERQSGTLSLAIGTDSWRRVGDAGYDNVYLHLGKEHARDLSYGDSDYPTPVTGETWTFSPAAVTTTGSEVTHPTLTEITSRPGVFEVACAATHGRPAEGFSVSASVTYDGATYMASVDHSKYPKICRPAPQE